jgi:hypothetical protein
MSATPKHKEEVRTMGATSRRWVPRRMGRPVPSLWLDDPGALVGEARLWADLATPKERRAYAAACFLGMTGDERRHVSCVLRQAAEA